MKNSIVEMLTPYASPQNVCVMGNEGVARAAIEAGVSGVFAYPGTPSTEISMIFSKIKEFQDSTDVATDYPEITQNKIYFEFSINEKIALEKAIAYAIGSKSAMACMKNVGLNVASDALMTIPYQTINGPLVVIVCDDPGCHSSSNEQDSRYFALSASIPLFDPASADEAYEMTKDAFALSEQLRLPVLVRLTTRVSHGRGAFYYNAIKSNYTEGMFRRDPININVPARTAVAHQRLLDKLQDDRIKAYFSKMNMCNTNGRNDQAVILSGIAATYFQEVSEINGLSDVVDTLKIGVIHPFPQQDILSFLQRGYSRILVLEEMDSIMENGIRIVAQKNKISVEIYGKGSYGLSTVGEYSVTKVNDAVAEFLNMPLSEKDTSFNGTFMEFGHDLPMRPPILCVGCPHRATFYAMKLVMPRDDDGMVLCGDIGCLGLGALPPMNMMDTVNHMGMSISMAQGLDIALEKGETGKTMALIGDGTFFHSGIPALLNAVYTGANISVIIFDNRTIAMTGGQMNPGVAKVTSGGFQQVDIEKLVRGMGIEFVESMDPFNLVDTTQKIKDAINYAGVSVLISKSPCIMLEKGKALPSSPIIVDQSKCKSCANHVDDGSFCSQAPTPEYGLARARAKLLADNHLPAGKQLCPANICNHGFFNAILAKDNKTALEIVRDKMLFARTCGDICHRPCEQDGDAIVPIRQLKHFVSSDSLNFEDHNNLKKRALKDVGHNHKIAIVGAGPTGLSAAYDLLLSGYSVSIFEKEMSPGGVLHHQIPNFRMDKQGLQSEINMLEALGATFNYGAALGEGIALSDLSRDYDAVLLAIGVGVSSGLDVIENTVPEKNRYNAMDFLKLFNDNKLVIEEGASIVVIGGGNSAMDAARAAKKLSPKNKVLLSCIENEENIPAFQEEVDEAREEGVEIIPNSFVKAVELSKVGKTGLELKTFDHGKPLSFHVCDLVITAIGQRGDGEMLQKSGIEDIDDSDRIRSDEAGKVTTKNNGFDHNVFVAGDIKSGHHMSLIGAIGGGKKAAVEIRQMLEDYQYPYEGEKALERLNSSQDANPQSSRKSYDIKQFMTNMKDFDLHQTCEMCNNCIDNFGCPSLVRKDGKITIEQSSCIRCGLCIDVCPNGAIQWQTSEVVS